MCLRLLLAWALPAASEGIYLEADFIYSLQKNVAPVLADDTVPDPAGAMARLVHLQQLPVLVVSVAAVPVSVELRQSLEVYAVDASIVEHQAMVVGSPDALGKKPRVGSHAQP